MEDIAHQLVEGVVKRLTGPMSFRFIVQPVVAIILGIRDGRLDAKAGTPAFAFDLIFRPEHRKQALRSASSTLLVPIIVGTVLDAIAQYLIFERVLLSAALLVGTFVMGVPYSIARGATNRIVTAAGARKRHGRRASPATGRAGSKRD